MDSFTVTAPTRVDLAGGTLDLWPIYCLLDGAKTINLAIDLQALVRFEPRPKHEFRIEVISPTDVHIEMDRILSPDQIAGLDPSLRFPVALICKFFDQMAELPDVSCRIDVKTTAPVGSGLGGSSTLAVALLRGLGNLCGKYLDQGWQWELMNWVKDLEAAYLMLPTGTQDYLAALFGGINVFKYDVGKIERESYPAQVLSEIEQRMVVLFSGEQHHSGMSNWEVYRRGVEGDKKIMQGFREIAQIANDLDSELRAGQLNWKYIGRFLSDEWKIRAELFQVQTPRLAELIEFLKGQSVLGAKVCGAAQGGSLLVLTEPSQKNALADACTANGIKVLPARVSPQGVTIHSQK